MSWLKGKLERIFFLPPSFFAFVAGGLIAAAINLLTGFALAETVSCFPFSFIFFLVSSFLFLALTIELEGIAEYSRRPQALPSDKADVISKRFSYLLGLFSTSLALGIVGVVFLVLEFVK